MIFMRERDGAHFLWNGEHPIGISPCNEGVYTSKQEFIEHCQTLLWHHKAGEVPNKEEILLDKALHSKTRTFTIPGQGRYQIIARGEFKEL